MHNTLLATSLHWGCGWKVRGGAPYMGWQTSTPFVNVLSIAAFTRSAKPVSKAV